MRIPILLLLALVMDTSGNRGGVHETRWAKGDFAAGTNDRFRDCETSGDVVAVRIEGRGESCLLRRKVYPMKLPCQVTFRVRFTEAQLESAYPTVHVVLDPPPLKNAWWSAPVKPRPGVWQNKVRGFLFHFPSKAGHWALFGVSESLESAPGRHAFRPEEGKWVRLAVALTKDRITVHADGKEVASCAADLGRVRTFTWGIGDQTATRVELDEVRIRRK